MYKKGLEIQDTSAQKAFWSNRYHLQTTGWDIGYPSTPIKEYFDTITDKKLKILIPGAGNAHEAEYLFQQGFENVFVLDIAPQPLDNFQRRNPSFPAQHLINDNFFEHHGKYDLIVEQTFFCSFAPTPAQRSRYAQQMRKLLQTGGKLVGLWFSFPLSEKETPPFGGSKEEYLSYFKDLFHIHTFEKCYNSIPQRQGLEYFGILEHV